QTAASGNMLTKWRSTRPCPQGRSRTRLTSAKRPAANAAMIASAALAPTPDIVIATHGFFWRDKGGNFGGIISSNHLPDQRIVFDGSIHLRHRFTLTT